MTKEERAKALDTILNNEVNRIKYLKLMKILHVDVGFGEYCRLILSDLKDVGNAILEGKEILYRGCVATAERLRFRGNVSEYTISEVDDFEAVKILVEGRFYWMAALAHEELCYKFVAKISNFTRYTPALERGLIFNTQRAAVEHANTLLGAS